MTHRPPTRRLFLTVTGSAALGGLAGCTDRLPTSSSDPDENPSNDSNSSNDSDENPSNDSDGSNPEEGGVPPLRTEFASREEYAQPGESLDDFEDESAWATVQGSSETDSDVVFDGSQSLKLSASGDQNIVVERSLADEDLTDLDFSLALRTTTPGNVAVYLRFVDVFGSDRAYQLRQITYRAPDVGWFRTNPGVFEDSEIETEMGELDRVQVVVLNTGPEAEVWVDDLRTHEKPDTGYVILSWDDGRRDFYDEAAPVHDEFDFRAVQAPIPGQNSGEGFMSVSQLKERQEAGDEIVVHGTHEPIHEYDESEIEPRLERDKQWYIDNGFEGADYIVYPHNSFDKTSLEYINEYHYCGGFNQSGDVNTTGVHGFDPLVLPRTIGHDLDIAKRCVDLAAKHNNCTILNFHGFDKSNTMSKDAYRELVEHIDGKGDDVEVITFDDLWQMRMDGH